MAAGGFHGAAVTHDGAVFTWGMGRQGALGHGDTANCLTPTRVNKLDGVNITQVAPSRLELTCVHVCMLAATRVI